MTTLERVQIDAAPARASVADSARSKATSAKRGEAARVQDIRLAIGVLNHRKIEKLMGTLDAKAPSTYLGDRGFRCLVQLWTRAGQSHRTGELRLSIEDIEWEAGWRGRDCRFEHEGLFVQSLLDCHLLDVVDDAYRLHDWIEHQPWVVEGQRASIAGRFNKLLGLARKNGLSPEEALQHAHAKVPEYAQLTGRTLEDDVDAVSNQPEQLEIQGVGASREQVLGEKPQPRQRRSPPTRQAENVANMMQRVAAPENLDTDTWRAFLMHRGTLRNLKQEECHALSRTLTEAVSEGICSRQLLQMMTERGYLDAALTVRLNRAELVGSGPADRGQAQSTRANPHRGGVLTKRPGQNDSATFLALAREGLMSAGIDADAYCPRDTCGTDALSEIED